MSGLGHHGHCGIFGPLVFREVHHVFPRVPCTVYCVSDDPLSKQRSVGIGFVNFWSFPVARTRGRRWGFPPVVPPGMTPTSDTPPLIVPLPPGAQETGVRRVSPLVKTAHKTRQRAMKSEHREACVIGVMHLFPRNTECPVAFAFRSIGPYQCPTHGDLIQFPHLPGVNGKEMRCTHVATPVGNTRSKIHVCHVSHRKAVSAWHAPQTENIEFQVHPPPYCTPPPPGKPNNFSSGLYPGVR